MIRVARIIHGLFTFDAVSSRFSLMHTLQAFLFLYLVVASILIAYSLPANVQLNDNQCLDAIASIILLGALCFHIASSMARDNYGRIDVALASGILATYALTVQSPILCNAGYYLILAILAYILSSRQVLSPWSLVAVLLISNLLGVIGLEMMSSPVLDRFGDYIRLENRQFFAINLVGFPFFTILIHTLSRLLRAREADLAALDAANRKLAESRRHLLTANRLASLGRLVSGIGHEMSNQLGAMLNALELIQVKTEQAQRDLRFADLSPKEQHDLVECVVRWSSLGRDAAARSIAFLRGVRAQSRLLAVEREEYFFLSHNLEGVVDLMRIECEKGGCELHTNLAEMDVTLYGDPGELSQVLINLIRNAIESYPAEDTRERLVRFVAWEDGERAVVQIIDRGRGIDPDHLTRIRDSFRSPSIATAGFGLSISHDIITHRFHGCLDIASRPDCGTTVSLTFPLRSRNDRKKATSSRESIPV